MKISPPVILANIAQGRNQYIKTATASAHRFPKQSFRKVIQRLHPLIALSVIPSVSSTKWHPGDAIDALTLCHHLLKSF